MKPFRHVHEFERMIVTVVVIPQGIDGLPQLAELDPGIQLP